MPTFVLTWNPDSWTDGEEWLATNAGLATAEHPVAEPWSTGSRRSGIAPGDRAVLLRQRRYRGIIGSGSFTSDIYEDQHWDGSGRPAFFADVDFDTITTADDRLPVEVLHADLPEVAWDRMQGSGVRLPDGAATRLEELWASHAGGWLPEVHPDEMIGEFDEGAIRRVSVNRYERSRAARVACLRHFGADCQICGFDFEATYGPIGARGIHVHHLLELSAVPANYRVNPVTDLLPVCPNCHAMLHTSSPALRPDQLRQAIRASGRPPTG